MDISNPPTNDQCTQRQAIALNTPVSGNSTAARPHGLTNTECSLHPYARGLFYAVTGTGTSLQLTWTIIDNNDNKDGRFEIAILSQTCFHCVQVSDFLVADDSPFTTTFDTEVNVEYVILVSGEGFGDTAAFTLEVQVRVGVGQFF